jgi:hypothetical protein
MPAAPPRFAARGVLGALRGLERVSDRLVPADVAAFLISVDFIYSRALGTFAELGIADQLDKPRTAAEIATTLDLDADALHRVMRLLALRGVLRLSKDGRFRLTRIGKRLRTDHPKSMRSWVRYALLDSTQQAWAGLTDTVRTGEPSFPAVHGRSVWDHFAATPEEERLFASCMRRLTQLDLPAITGGYPWPETGTVCDVAGGVGTLLAGILRARPRLNGVLVDAPGVLGEASPYLDEAGVRERVTLSEGNMFERVDARADVYTLKDVLHDWDDERCLTILKTLRAAMPPGSRVVLVENLQEPNVPDPVGSMVDLQMLTQCDGGRQRSVTELHDLLRRADLRPGEVRKTAGPALVEGIA